MAERRTPKRTGERAVVPELVRRAAERKLADFCERRVPVSLRLKVRCGFRFKGGAAILFEERPYFDDPSEWTRQDIAKFGYDSTNRVWTLFAADRRFRWFRYEPETSSPDVADLLAEVERDPTGIFWG